jgi:tryptophanyl-tRNA synthetase
VAKLAPIGGEMTRLLADPGHIDQILGRGAARARALAEPIYDEVKRIMGFVRA